MRPEQRKAFLRNHPEHADWYYDYETVVKDYNETFEQGDKDDKLLADGIIDNDEFTKRCKDIVELQSKLYEKMNDLTEKMMQVW